MKPMDETQTERVWSRVMCAQAGTQSCAVKAEAALEAQPKAEALRDCTLLELVQREYQDFVTYGTLARMSCGCARAALTDIARQEQCHARRLAALYFLRSGKKACPECARRPCVACFNEALRQRYQEELEAAKAYRALACGEGGEIFACLAEQETAHAKKLLDILQCTL